MWERDRTWKEVVEGDMKSLKLSKADTLVNGDDWLEVLRRIVMIAGVNVSDYFWYQLNGLSWTKGQKNGCSCCYQKVDY